MNIINLQPHWIISFKKPETDSSDPILSKTEEALSSFTQLEIGNVESNKWWVVDNFIFEDEESLKKSFDLFIQNTTNNNEQKLIPVSGGKSRFPAMGNLMPNKLTISLIGDLDDPVSRKYLLPFASHLFRFKEYAPGILSFTINVYIQLKQDFFISGRFDESARIETALFFTSLKNLQDVAYGDKFNLYIFSDKNRFNNNDQGYENLTPDEQAEQVALTVLHHAISNLPEPDNTGTSISKIFNCGAASIFIDSEQIRWQQANQLLAGVIESFKNNDAKPWKDEAEANRIISENNFGLFFSNKSVFAELAAGISNENFRQSLSLDKKVAIWLSPDPHPWDIFNPALIQLYFKSFIKTLPLNLKEYIHLYISQVIVSIDHSLTNALELFKKGTETKDGIEKKVQKTVFSVWDSHSNASGLKQFDRVIEKAIEIIEAEKAALVEFRQKELNNVELFIIPKTVRKHYKKFKLQLFAETVDQLYSADISENPDKYEGYEKPEDKFFVFHESKILAHLVKVLKKHPVPLGLFMKGIMMGSMSAILGFAIVRLLPRFLVNLGFLAEPPFRIPVIVVFFLVPLFIVWCRYQLMTLNHIRKSITEYAALTLAVARYKSLEMIASSIDKVYEKSINTCDDLLKRAQKFREEFSVGNNLKQNHFLNWRFIKPLDEKFEGEEIVDIKPHGKIHTEMGDKLFQELNEADKHFIMKHFIHLRLEGTEQEEIWEQILKFNENENAEIIKTKGMESLLILISQQSDSISGWIFLNNGNLRDGAMQKIRAVAFPPAANAGVNIIPQYQAVSKISSGKNLDDFTMVNADTCDFLSMRSIRTIGTLGGVVVNETAPLILDFYFNNSDQLDMWLEEAMKDSRNQDIIAYVMYLRNYLNIVRTQTDSDLIIPIGEPLSGTKVGSNIKSLLKKYN